MPTNEQNFGFTNFGPLQASGWFGDWFRNAAGVTRETTPRVMSSPNSAKAVGYQTLMDILQSQGMTDPSYYNMQLANVQRGTQASQQNAQSSLAQAGLQGSGLGQALQAAIGQGGENRKAQISAQEAQLAEARKREDLNLLLSLIIGPQLQKYGIDRGVYAQTKEPSTGAVDWLTALGTLAVGLGGL